MKISRLMEIKIEIEAMKDYLRWMDEQIMTDSVIYSNEDYIVASRVIGKLRMERDYIEEMEDDNEE